MPTAGAPRDACPSFGRVGCAAETGLRSVQRRGGLFFSSVVEYFCVSREKRILFSFFAPFISKSTEKCFLIFYFSCTERAKGANNKQRRYSTYVHQVIDCNSKSRRQRHLPTQPPCGLRSSCLLAFCCSVVVPARRFLFASPPQLAT